MAKIIIHRKREWSLKLGYSSIFEVFLDGQRIGYLSNGETKEFDFPAGQHKIKAKTWWYGSQDFNFTLFNKENKSFNISTNKSLMILVPILIFIHVFFKYFPG